MAVTLKDIATKAGVSQAAVSIALGSSGRIAEATRERILKIAQDLGYRPNLLVQGIQTGRTQTIGLLMKFTSGYEAKLFEGIYAGLSARNYAPIVMCPDENGKELEQVHALLDRRVDGVLIRPVADALWEDHLIQIQQRGVPIVALDTEIQAADPHIDFVGTDDHHGAQVLAEHLLELGHRRFGVVSRGVFPDPLFARAQAFIETVGAAPDTTCEERTAGWRDGRYEDNAARALLGMNNRPTAIFGTTDDLADIVAQVAADRGLSIPQDFSLVGFSDTVDLRQVRPVLTTVRQSAFEIARKAATLLLDRINEKHTPGTQRKPRESILYDPELIVRETTAPPPGA